MREKKNTLRRENGKVITSSRVYGENAYTHFMAYKQEYDKRTYRRYVFRLVNAKEPELIEFVNSQEFLTEYVKGLIRKDYERQVKGGKWTPSKDVQKKLAELEKKNAKKK